MKYIITAIICIFIGVGVMQLNADAPEGIYGNTYESDGETALCSTEVHAEAVLSVDEYEGNTKDSQGHYYYCANDDGSPNPEAWHFYIPYGGWYKLWGYKEVEGGYWYSGKSNSIFYGDGQQSYNHDINCSFYGSE